MPKRKITPLRQLAFAVLASWVDDVAKIKARKQESKYSEFVDWLDSDDGQMWCKTAGIKPQVVKILLDVVTERYRQSLDSKEVCHAAQ